MQIMLSLEVRHIGGRKRRIYERQKGALEWSGRENLLQEWRE